MEPLRRNQGIAQTGNEGEACAEFAGAAGSAAAGGSERNSIRKPVV